jgi:hypothetical protein
MKWLLENHFPYDNRTFKYAVTNGNLTNMKLFAPALPGSLRETQLRLVLDSPIILKIFYN